MLYEKDRGFEMTLQPFCIVHSNNNLKGKYHFFDHRGSELAIYKKMPKNFLNKLLSYPITAFGYRFVDLQSDINPKFDRTDVIKALDFWIEHWVYQNKKDYILEGTVNKDFELTVRELIETREAVLKMPVDTQFVRQKIRVNIEEDGDFSYEKDYSYYRFEPRHREVITNMSEYQIQEAEKQMGKPFPKTKIIHKHKPDYMVEFTQNVLTGSNSSSASTVDQFCYVVRKMTYKEYMEQKKNKPYATGSVMYDWEENFRGNNRFDFRGLGAGRDDEMSIRMWGARHADGGGGGLGSIIRPDEGGRTVPADGTNPTNWIIVDDGAVSPNTFRIINTDGVHIAGGFDTRVSAELYLINVREHFLPSEVSVPTDNPVDSPDFDPNIPATPALGTEQQSLVFEPMIVTDINNDILFPSDPNRFMTVPIRFFGSGAEITMNMMISSSQFDVLSRPFTNHIIRITPGSPSPVEIDGQEYHTIDVSISHNPMRPSIRFDNLWIESMNRTNNTVQINLLQQGNGLVRTNLSIIFHGSNSASRDGFFDTMSMRNSISHPLSLQMLGDNRVNIGADVYTVREPINITIR